MKALHRNLLIASNLYRASALLTVLAYFFSDVGGATFPELLTVALTLIAAYLIRLGLKWLKWLLLAWELVYLPIIVTSLLPWQGSTGVNILSVVVELLQIAALVFLFLPRKEEPEDEDDEDDDQPADTE